MTGLGLAFTVALARPAFLIKRSQIDVAFELVALLVLAGFLSVACFVGKLCFPVDFELEADVEAAFGL